MTETPELADDLRDKILTHSDAILEDADLLQALVDADARARGANVVDLRGVAMERLEARLSRLEDTHRSVIAAAYENLAGTNQVHRAVLALLDPLSFDDFLTRLTTEVADILRVNRVLLVLESHEDDAGALARLGDMMSIAEPGFVDDYIAPGQSTARRAVTLREVPSGAGGLYGAHADTIRSEALIRLDFGPNRLPGLLAFGSDDPTHFTPAQAVDLLVFFGGVFERSMRRFLE